MRIAITGSTGFIGKNLVRSFFDREWSVIELKRGITQDQMVEEMTEHRTEVVVHLASLFIAEHKSGEVDDLIASNVAFGSNVLEAMKRAQVKRFLNTGTSWEHYGDAERDPVCLYAASKLAFEEIIRYYVNVEALSCIGLKIFDTYGPGDHRPKLLPKLIENFKTMMPLDLSPGEQKLNFVHIQDIEKAFATASERLLKMAPGRWENYALASGEEFNLQEIVAVLEAAKGKKFTVRWGARPYRRREVMHPWRGGKSLPGWQAEIAFADGIKALLADK